MGRSGSNQSKELALLSRASGFGPDAFNVKKRVEIDFMRRTIYLDLEGMARLVAEVGLVPMLRTLTDRLRDDYARWEAFQKCPRTANHSPLGVVELMPISDDRLFTFKFVNGHPQNPKAGLPTVMAFGALAEMETGWPLLLSEMTLLTGIRTAATSALAARYMARPDAQSMAMIGNGAQSEFQILAFHHLLGIEEFRLFDIDPAATQKLLRNLGEIPGVRLVRCESTAEAVRGADIVTTSTADKAYATILTPEMIEPGMHLNAIGGDCPGKTELAPQILEKARVVAEYLPQSRIEGEIQQMPESFEALELWQLVRGEAPGRSAPDEVTVFDSVGFSLEDFSALCLVHGEAEKRELGEVLDLMPQDRDVKDLYGLLQSARVTS